MTRFSQFAAPAILGAALMFGGPGCASDGPDITADAQMLSEGRRTVSATAPNEGTVYIFNDTRNETVYSGRVNRGDTIRVDAKENRVLLNNNVAIEKDLQNDHRYQIFFDKKRLTEADIARYRDGSTVITTPSGESTVITPPPAPNTTVVQPPPAPSNTTVVQPAQPRSNTTIVQPAQPSDTTVIPPAPDDGGRTVVQPDGTTVVTPSR